MAPLRDEPGTLLLHGGEPRSRHTYLMAFPAFQVIEDDPRIGFEALGAQHRWQASGEAEGVSGGYAGLMGYELGHAFERWPEQPAGLCDWPAVAMGWYDAVAVFDEARQWLEVRGEPAAAARLAGALGAREAEMEAGRGSLSMVWSEAEYLSAAQKARDYVRAGDVFQVNLSHPFRGTMSGVDAPFALMERLASQSPAAYSAYYRLDAHRAVVTNSPERFFHLDASGAVETRPIKGTRPRHNDPQIDAFEREALSRSEKDRAENLMIVDLMRNDIARVCEPGSVRAPDLFKIESFANVHHLVSTVTGQLAKGRDVYDLLQASFPPGSITGAPKPRAMEIIAELEGEARGPYCGSLGWIGADGASDLNVMIRTAAMVRQDGCWALEVRSGGAITIDSDPASELAETQAKAGALRRAIEHG
ncbi:anthranilate synthase component I family protein [Maricaulaceae bacterium EIL42A08]|nr:anthranilate synthase component I family protein [Maricaulaceae bacterium EIL42A08]